MHFLWGAPLDKTNTSQIQNFPQILCQTRKELRKLVKNLSNLTKNLSKSKKGNFKKFGDFWNLDSHQPPSRSGWWLCYQCAIFRSSLHHSTLFSLLYSHNPHPPSFCAFTDQFHSFIFSHLPCPVFLLIFHVRQWMECAYVWLSLQ